MATIQEQSKEEEDKEDEMGYGLYDDVPPRPNIQPQGNRDVPPEMVTHDGDASPADSVGTAPHLGSGEKAPTTT